MTRMIKNGFLCLLLMITGLFGGPSLQFGAGAGAQAVLDLNTSSLIWKGNGIAGKAAFSTTLASGIRYQVDIAVAYTEFKPAGSNYFSLSDATAIDMLTRFLQPISAGNDLMLLAGWGFSSPVLTVRHSNLWSMTTVIEGSLDLTASAGFDYVHGPWEISFTADLPVLSVALVQDYSASGNHVLQFASLHNSFQLFGKAGCMYRIAGRSLIGIEAKYAHRAMNVIKPVATWVYGANLIYQIEL